MRTMMTIGMVLAAVGLFALQTSNVQAVDSQVAGTWCSLCNRLIPAGQTCPHMRGGNQGGGRGAVYSPPSGPSAEEIAAQQQQEAARQAEEEAERQAAEAERQRAIEEQQKKAQAEAAQREADFQKAKRDALSSMKGITENELGLKGIGASDDFGLKGVGETKTSDFGLKGLDGDIFSKPNGKASVGVGSKGSSQLDLPGGKDVLNPARNNENFKKGYDILRNGDLETALRCFEQAQWELPNDPMVRDALQMVRGMIHLRQEKNAAMNQLLSHSPADARDEIAEFLFPGKAIFPKNPDKPLLNPLIEKKKAASLPNPNESPEDFAVRFTKTDLFKQIEPLYIEEIKPWGSGKVYPRGTYPAADKAVDAAIDRMSNNYNSGVRDACRKAAETMNAEYAKMEQAGLIKPGEDLKQREEKDVAYENAMMPIRHCVYEQLGKDIGDVMARDQVALDRLKEKIPEMQRKNWNAQSDVAKYLFPADKP